MNKAIYPVLLAFLFSCQEGRKDDSGYLEDLKNDLSSAASIYPWIRDGYNRETLDVKPKSEKILFKGVKVSFREFIKASVDEVGRLELTINQESPNQDPDKIVDGVIFLIDHFTTEDVFEIVRKSVLEDLDYLENIESEEFNVKKAFLIHSEKLAVLTEGTPTVFKQDVSENYMAIVVDRSSKKEVWLRAEDVFLHGTITGRFEPSGRNTEILDLAFSR